MANVTFRCGTKSIPVGASEVALAGLVLPFVPDSVIVSVRQPSADSDLITAYVTGELTADGFSVALSSAPSVEGYYIDWTASKGSEQTVDNDTLAVSYADLVKIVARFLGYNDADLTDLQKDEVDSYIQSGVRNFYYPPKMEGVDENFEWGFIRQRGAVVTEAGVDTYVMPAGFGRIAGQLVVEGVNAKSIPVIPYGDIIRMKNRTEYDPGIPRFAAIVSEQSYNDRGQGKRLVLFPAPGGAYTVRFECDADTGKLDEEIRPYPLGGAMFSELIIESCLAVAEQRANDATDLHTNNFNRLLVSMIARDRKSSAQVFGQIGDPDARYSHCCGSMLHRHSMTY